MPKKLDIEIIKKVEEILNGSSNKTELEHGRKTLEWLLRLKPNADQAMQVAALGHDIERSMHTPKEREKATLIE